MKSFASPSSWRIRNRYGFGAANVMLCPEPYWPPDPSLSLAADLREAGRDFAMASLPAMLAAVVVAGMLAVVGSIEQDLAMDLEVMMIRNEPIPEPIVEPLLPESSPPVELVKVAEVPPPPVVPEPEPEPPPQLAVKPAPPPPPAVVEVAKKPPPPPPVVRPQIDRVESAPLLVAKSEPTRRTRLPETIARRNVAPEPLVAPAAPMPSMPQRAARTARFAPVRAPEVRGGARSAVKVAAAPMLGAPAGTPRHARARRVVAASPQALRRVPAVDFARTSSPQPLAAMSPQSPRRRVASTAPRARRSAPRPVLTSPGLAAPAPSLRASPTQSRHAPKAALALSVESRQARLGLAGVPLASLAACVSEREEEALKRQLLAAVTTREMCSSSAGRYRFVETKNLNAFLMTVERASSRAAGDRCVELKHALACVAP